jgi:hypothetical protein
MYAESIKKVQELIIALGNLQHFLSNNKKEEDWSQDEWQAHSAKLRSIYIDAYLVYEDLLRSEAYVSPIQDQTFTPPHIPEWYLLDK